MAAFKDGVNGATVRALAGAIAPHTTAFDRERFEREAVAGLDALELKARIAHIAAALHGALAGPFAQRAPEVAAGVSGSGLGMWEAWPAQTWVEEHGLGEPDVALEAIGAMTARASGEMAVRPYLDRHPETAWRHVRAWAGSDDVHRRRLASEGTRPRLPWARRVAALIQDPTPGIAILDTLRDDPEEYVRRSVANHLNDVAKDHPEAALAVAERWAGEPGPHAGAVVRHALRSLIKAGEPRALALIGADAGTQVVVGPLELRAPSVAIGGRLRFATTLTAPTGGRVVVDYAIHYVGARGLLKAPKVFKGGVRDLRAGEPWRFEREHALDHVSIRRLNPGTHRVDLRVNGSVRAAADFELIG